MLKPDFLFHHRALWEKRVGVGVNRAEYGEPIELPCRVEVKRGCESMTGRIFLPAACGAGPGDRVTVEGGQYLLKAVSAFPTHIEGELA